MYRTNIVRVISTANYGTKGKSTAQREEEKKLNDVKQRQKYEAQQKGKMEVLMIKRHKRWADNKTRDKGVQMKTGK